MQEDKGLIGLRLARKQRKLNQLKVAMDLNIKRAIQISSTAVYGIPDHHPLYETDKLIGVGPYGIAKIEAEIPCLQLEG